MVGDKSFVSLVSLPNANLIEFGRDVAVYQLDTCKLLNERNEHHPGKGNDPISFLQNYIFTVPAGKMALLAKTVWCKCSRHEER